MVNPWLSLEVDDLVMGYPIRKAGKRKKEKE
jgi:hypothetical protein